MKEFSHLTSSQLYTVLQNKNLDDGILKQANDEFNKRRLNASQIEEIALEYDRKFIASKKEPLNFKYKFLLILFPFALEIQSLIALRFLVRRENKKWKDYWLFISIGYLLWTIIIILIAKYHFVNPQ